MYLSWAEKKVGQFLLLGIFVGDARAEEVTVQLVIKGPSSSSRSESNAGVWCEEPERGT